MFLQLRLGVVVIYLCNLLLANCKGEKEKDDVIICFSDHCLPSDYDKVVPPFNEFGTMNISVNLDILQIMEINDVKFTVSALIYVGVLWEDPRIIGPEPEDPTKMVTIDIGFVNYIWLPDIYIYDLKEITIPKFYIPFAGLWLINKTTIFYSQETHITFWCPMRFLWYPLDNQVCKFRIGSFAYDLEQMVFLTSKLAYDSSVRNTILDYKSEVSSLPEEDKLYIWEGVGNFSLAGFELKLSRHTLKYFVNYYLPSGLFVIVSWASFLIPSEMVSGRMTLLVTLFLVLISIFNNITSSSPNVEGLSSISAWVITCIFFVFGSFLGFAGMLFKKNAIKKTNSIHASMYKKESYNNEELNRIDNIFLMAFPAMFILFNIIYWPICTREYDTPTDQYRI